MLDSKLLNYNNFLAKFKNNNFIYPLKKNYGIGIKTIFRFVTAIGLNPHKLSISSLDIIRFNWLLNQFYFCIDQYKNKIYTDVEKKKKKKNYSGMRHILKLPVRGQRSHTNSKSIRRYKITQL